MILVVDALNRHLHEDLLDQMFRLRARVFDERMGWDVTVTDGKEIDDFDRLDPAYILSLDETGEVVGCARLLQTTGPHMLADVFSDILCGEPPLRSAQVWESTRFCVDTARLADKTGRDHRSAVSRVTCEVMIGTLEFSRTAGITDIVAVIDPVMNRVLKRSDNAPYDYVGETVPMGKVKAMAALIDVTQERIDRVRAFAGIEGDIMLDPDSVPVFQRDGESEIEAYCRDQIASAETEEDLMAALALRRELITTRRTT